MGVLASTQSVEVRQAMPDAEEHVMIERLQERLGQLRDAVGHALASDRYDHVRPVRVARELLGTANDLLGRPFPRPGDDQGPSASHEPAAREAAPVVVYFDGKDHRTKTKVEELLKGRGISFRVLDVSEDESTRSFATTAAKQSEFPLVFIAGSAVGGLHELMQLDVNGELSRRVFGE
jgi:glutaredoxin